MTPFAKEHSRQYRKHYERLERLYAALKAQGESTVRELALLLGADHTTVDADLRRLELDHRAVSELASASPTMSELLGPARPCYRRAKTCARIWRAI